MKDPGVGRQVGDVPSVARPRPPIHPGAAARPDEERIERFRRVYETTHGDLTGYCRRRVPPTIVDDVVADVFTIAWQRLDDVVGDVRPWLFGVAHNLIRNQRRRAARGAALAAAIVHDLLTRQPADGERTVDELSALVAALHSLPDGDAEVIRLAAWEALDHRDIAVVLGCSENAVAIRLHRARKRLRALLDRDERWPGTPAPTTSRKGAAPLRQVEGDGADEVPGTGTTTGTTP